MKYIADTHRAHVTIDLPFIDETFQVLAIHHIPLAVSQMFMDNRAADAILALVPHKAAHILVEQALPAEANEFFEQWTEKSASFQQSETNADHLLNKIMRGFHT